MGFISSWLCWLSAWCGNAAMANGWVLYVEHFVNTGHNVVLTIMLTLAGIWLAAGINLLGISSMG